MTAAETEKLLLANGFERMPQHDWRADVRCFWRPLCHVLVFPEGNIAMRHTLMDKWRDSTLEEIDPPLGTFAPGL